MFLLFRYDNAPIMPNNKMNFQDEILLLVESFFNAKVLPKKKLKNNLSVNLISYFIILTLCNL